MELDLQLTPRSRVLLGILGGLFLILLAIQGGPAFYRLFANQDTKAKQEQLLKTEDLVHVAEVLKPIESEIYKETGLAPESNQQARAGHNASLHSLMLNFQRPSLDLVLMRLSGVPAFSRIINF